VQLYYDVGPWGDCSAPSGGGTQTGAVACMAKAYGVVGRRPVAECLAAGATPLVSVRPCEAQPCASDITEGTLQLRLNATGDIVSRSQNDLLEDELGTELADLFMMLGSGSVSVSVRDPCDLITSSPTPSWTPTSTVKLSLSLTSSTSGTFASISASPTMTPDVCCGVAPV
jgi:hypothetical protein